MPDVEAGLAHFDQLRRRDYFSCRALLARPPSAYFTQTLVGARLVLPRNAQEPPLTGVVAMSAPGQVAPEATPLWISTLAAKVPLASREVVPSTRSCVPARSARLMLTVSVPAAGGGAGAAAFTVCVTTAEVLAKKVGLPPYAAVRE